MCVFALASRALPTFNATATANSRALHMCCSITRERQMVQVVELPARKKRVRIVVGFALLLLAAGGVVYWYFGVPPETRIERRALPAIPVTVANVVVRDVPVYLTGLGIVQASNTT